MKALIAVSIIATFVAAPSFAGCIEPLNNVKIPNGNKATMDEIMAANYALQQNATEAEGYAKCLKTEREAKITAWPDITDEQKAKITSEYVNRQNAEDQKLQDLADHYDLALRTFRAKQAANEAAERDNEEAAAVKAAEQDAAAKARQAAAAQKAAERAETQGAKNNIR